MSPGTAERRPEQGAASAEMTGQVPPSVAPAARNFDSVDVASVVSGAYAVVALVDDQHARRRVYLSLAPAERAAEKARARGQRAEVVLVQLVAVGTVGRSDAGGTP